MVLAEHLPAKDAGEHVRTGKGEELLAIVGTVGSGQRVRDGAVKEKSLAGLC